MNKLSKPFQQKMKIDENCSSCFREDVKKLHNFIHVYHPGQGQIFPMGQNFDCN